MERRINSLGDSINDILDSLVRDRAVDANGKLMLTTM